ncbi:MAG: hypothetical protein COZ06_24305 [Armatimonadetes bacterium CG_4_10_14_3_um_filter_66_18]|nr:toll/interleukin-1 receptor domain-containing protein [Armatimonadota bacterium]PIU93030.1 MAG: hypothetical protein COS65_14880 [Armatimonadetes bacterium CG06_land_8_20_14_3_00_66_21]PIX40825.1 MAG: hypothetical protein COZ57_24950 [Armatimonadetes bacterium CG_4_8_14_3_um_filter_66_20]PIY42842.1 MAG: hypothetical protein COZ06_24305 [Armatimonadetes bacterium CG_4_10_14_3_um_filter_66_18]PIZ48164.1 MAG: hypothetical protein COY42_07025 [Armatimonadetes bacterium CG_4_10_14_0_8_um_filter_6
MVNVFFSYSHHDETMRNQLETHLAVLKREGAIDTYNDRRITAGKEFAREISEHLEAAQVVLLLVSPYFLDSERRPAPVAPGPWGTLTATEPTERRILACSTACSRLRRPFRPAACCSVPSMEA